MYTTFSTHRKLGLLGVGILPVAKKKGHYINVEFSLSELQNCKFKLGTFSLQFGIHGQLKDAYPKYKWIYMIASIDKRHGKELIETIKSIELVTSPTAQGFIEYKKI